MAKVWKMGDHINTDQIIPGRYYPRENIEELGDFCLCELNPEFSANRKSGDVIVAGQNFGCGSSREYAPIAIIQSGVSCIIAESFARIFFRNCINLGLPLFVCPGISETEQGDELEVDFKTGVITNISKEKSYKSHPLPQFINEIKIAGGIVNYVKEMEV